MSYNPAMASALLVRSPSVLRAFLSGLPEPLLDARDGPGAWSPREVACHLADLEQDAWVPRAQAILDHGSIQPLSGVDRERFRERFAGASISDVLNAFEVARIANLRTLGQFPMDEAARSAVGLHIPLGEVRLSELLSAWVVHDLTHLAQISRALAAQYRDEVGPRAQYLSILRPRSAPAEHVLDPLHPGDTP